MGKKKLSKKEKAKLEAEQAETLRIEMERERQKKLEEDRERKMRERRDAKKKQEQEAVENKLRRVQLRNSSHFAKKSREQIKRMLKEEKMNSEWKSYMRCNGLPNANDPSDLRKYMHMWNDEIHQNNKKEINWMLKTNEQSFLTQDQTVVDMSRENMKKLQPNMGEKYANRTTEVLGILNEIDSVICNRYSLSPTKLEDLLDLKSEIRIMLEAFVDEFTFKILSNIERNMTLIGLTQATFRFESPVFVKEIYAIRDIPLPPPSNPKEKMKEEKTNIEFEKLKMSLLLPSSIRCQNASIRGMWMNFDHKSEYCYSIIRTHEDGERKKLTLRQTTKREWKKRKELLQKALVQIFNEKPDENDEQNQPRVIDVDRMYTEYEDGLNAIEREKMGPGSLNLDEFEVNLRSHRITGGVFRIEYFEQPLQDVKSDEGGLLRTLIHPVKLKSKEFHYFYQPPPVPKAGQKRTPEEVELEVKYMEENMERMVLVNIDLPDNVSWFEPPVVCRFETEEEFQQVKLMEAELKKKIKRDDEDDDVEDEVEVKITPEHEKKLNENIEKKPSTVKQMKIVEDFNLLDIPKNINLKPLFDEFVIPMIPEGYEIKFETKKPFNVDGKKCYIEMNKIHTISDIMYQTNQPKFLHPKWRTLKILKVVKNRKEHFNSIEMLSFDEADDYDESMNSMESIDRINQTNNQQFYMFSKFMRDLEDLIDSEIPSFERKISEISANLSKTNEESSPTSINDKKVDRKDSGMSLTKTNSKSLIDPNDGDSDADSDTDNEEIEEENANRLMIDTKFKSANYKRCIGRWSTRDIHDSKFNEDKLTIQFRTGRLGYFAFASNRFSNFPYQSWEFKPEFKIPGAVIFTLTAAQLVMELTVTDAGVALNSLQGGNSPTVLNNICGEVMKLDELIKLLRSCACDVFPEDDSFCYTETSCEKNFVLEMNIYNSMSNFVLSHNFAWSRWNFAAGSRTCVFLMRELQEMRKLPNQSTIHVTPFKAGLIDCTEVSPTYCSTSLPGDYYADLFQLVNSKLQPAARSKMDEMSPILRQNMFEILKSIRPLSFC